MTEKFNLQHQLVDLFPKKIKPVRPSNWLRQSLVMAYEMPLTNEKSKAERVVSPILSEVVHNYRTKMTLFSGEDLTVNAVDDLSGPCDFFFALHPPKLSMEAPVITLVEAKDEDMDWGIGQCAAQMYAAMLYNQQHNKAIEVVFGCATTGKEWQFIKLEGQLFSVDRTSMTDLATVLGAWHLILQSY